MRLLLALIICTQISFAQTADGYFFFTIKDTAQVYLTPRTSGVSMGCVLQGHSEAQLSVHQIADTEILYVQIPESLLGQPAMLQVARSKGNAQEVMLLSFKTAVAGSPAGCHRCLVSDLIFSPAKVVIDMPAQPASWKMLSQKNMYLGGKEIMCTDITILQPFADVGR
jgi:hypothetical protein